MTNELTRQTLKMSEVQTLLGLSKVNILHLLKTGQLKGRQFNGVNSKWIIPITAIDNYLTS